MWLLAGASSIALAGVVVTIATRPVEADVHLARPDATATLAAPVSSSTPASLTPLQPKRKHYSDALHGLASWYGSAFNGRLTASGEQFEMYAMTACHPTLPFGSLVRVVNRDNHRSVVVRITDRGYLEKGRIIDLSYGAARQLAMTEQGIARIDLQVISRGPSGSGQ
jgi:rare lipoprotein A